MTHGPAMRTNGLPPPMEMSSSVTGITESLYRRDSNLPDLPAYPTLCHRRGRPRGRVRGPAAIRGLDEAGEQRMRMKRLGFELRMELDSQIPRVSGQLGDLD